MDYSAFMVTRSEHDLMVKSVPTVYDDANLGSARQSRWSRLMAGLRALTGHVLTSPPNPPHSNRPALMMSNPSPFLREQSSKTTSHEPA